MNIAIVDDEPSKAKELAELLSEYASKGGLEITVDFFDSGEAFLSDYHAYAYTAIFMDIYMEEMTGIEAAQKVAAQDRKAIIIFLTSSNEHMPEAFSVHAYDYIEKPAKRERIFKVMDDLIMRKTMAEDVPVFSFVSEKTNIALPYTDIVYIRTGKHNYLEICDKYKIKYSTRLTISEVSKSLQGDHRFLTVLRGIIVNMDYIKYIEDGTCMLSSGECVPVNVKNTRELLTTWQNYKFDSIRAGRRERRNKK
ncbi:MAG: LytTR family DNA-binding domain-containing protein [Clostridia bacterium]|nr:LytTR family DNA-binding domain-containing protein [Clostridia bacterium]